ncbi:MAG: FAD-dependent oxidoreductase [Alphaproteobacteria bacterium]|nr:FAD-dependent oxidoreductase [Alphaproteobacteria bacterium]
MDVVDVDVVVIGGGVPGLAAVQALALAERSVLLVTEELVLGEECVTAEAWQASHGAVDLGLTYWSPAQNYAFQELVEKQLELVETQLPSDKEWVFELRDGTLHHSPGEKEVFPGGELADRLIDELDDLSLLVGLDPRRPHRALDAAELDAHTVASWVEAWFDRQPDADAVRRDLVRQSLAAGLRAVFGAELHEIGMLYLLHYGASAGTFGWLVVPVGAFAVRFRDGARSLVGAFEAALGLGTHGPPVWRGVQVEAVRHLSTGVEVQVRGLPLVRAQRAIVAGPPASWPDLPITFDDPALASQWAARLALAREVRHGRCIRAFVSFRSPFWLEAGLQATVLATREPAAGPIAWTLDHSWPEGHPQAPSHPYVVACNLSGAYADHWRVRTRADRREAVIAQLERILGPRTRQELVDDGLDYLENLDQPGGSIVGTAPVIGAGVLTRLGSAFELLGDEVGRLGVASRVLAEQWSGTLEGALHAGDRAGTRAARALDTPLLPTPGGPVAQAAAGAMPLRRPVVRCPARGRRSRRS